MWWGCAANCKWNIARAPLRCCPSCCPDFCIPHSGIKLICLSAADSREAIFIKLTAVQSPAYCFCSPHPRSLMANRSLGKGRPHTALFQLLRQILIKLSRATLNSPCKPSWPWSFSSLASVSQVVERLWRPLLASISSALTWCIYIQANTCTYKTKQMLFEKLVKEDKIKRQ